MYIFFFRKFPDLDHLAPVIYKTSIITNKKILVLCQNPHFNFKDDYRIKFLVKKKNVTVDYIYNKNMNKSKIAYKIISYFILNSYLYKDFFKAKSFNVIALNFLTLPIKIFVNRFFGFLYQKLVVEIFFSYSWCYEFLKTLNPKTIVFDHIGCDKYLTMNIMKASKDLNIKSLSLPHGAPLFSKGYHAKNSNIYDKEIKLNFNKVIVANKRIANHRIINGYKKRKIKVLGSSRFSNEWIKIHDEIIPSQIVDLTNKIKIVYFERSAMLDKDKIVLAKNFLESMNNFKHIKLAVKPSVRSNKTKLNNQKNIINGDKINSVNLINWADIVIGSTSSILIESFIKNKLFIYPKFLQDDPMIFEEYKSCCIINSISELENVIKKINDNKTFKPYSRKNTLSMLEETIYNGNKNNDVLKDYAYEILI